MDGEDFPYVYGDELLENVPDVVKKHIKLENMIFNIDQFDLNEIKTFIFNNYLDRLKEVLDLICHAQSLYHLQTNLYGKLVLLIPQFTNEDSNSYSQFFRLYLKKLGSSNFPYDTGYRYTSLESLTPEELLRNYVYCSEEKNFYKFPFIIQDNVEEFKNYCILESQKDNTYKTYSYRSNVRNDPKAMLYLIVQHNAVKIYKYIKENKTIGAFSLVSASQHKQALPG